MNKINNEKILEVKDLRISFKVDNGTVKAVRGISFDLYRGRTLCIVGESGSGKSVTSRAVLGILANNKIVEGGEIIYDGKDLLSLNEDKFTKIRGSKISMIFQDPLSSLNPIMRVGKQLTEPMFLKAKANRRESKMILSKLNSSLSRFNKNIDNPLDKGLVAALKEEVKQTVKNEKIDYTNERNERYLNKQKDIISHKDKYNDAEIKRAEKFIASHPNGLDKIEHIDVNVLDESLIESLLASLSKLIKLGHDEYIENLRLLKSLLEEISASHLKDDRADYLPIKKRLKEIRALVKKTFAFKMDEDDTISVFPVSLKKYLKDCDIAIKNETKEEKRKAKNEAKGLNENELSPKERAKLPERMATLEEKTEELKNLFANCIAHLDEVINSSFDENEYAKEFLSYWKKTLATSYKVVNKDEAKDRALELMKQVGIPEPERRFRQYPFEFSGGMRQRIVIAIALSSRPEILICDEPTTALDVTIQAQILELINKLKEELNLSIIFITHDLGVVANMADDIAVMYAGKIVEYGTVEDIFYDPRHPYTWALLSSMPDLETKEKLEAIPGTPPNMILPPKGDAFASRNKYALALDFEKEPPLFRVSDTHYAATWLLLKDAPKVELPKIVTTRIKNALSKKKTKKEAK